MVRVSTNHTPMNAVNFYNTNKKITPNPYAATPSLYPLWGIAKLIYSFYFYPTLNSKPKNIPMLLKSITHINWPQKSNFLHNLHKIRHLIIICTPAKHMYTLAKHICTSAKHICTPARHIYTAAKHMYRAAKTNTAHSNHKTGRSPPAVAITINKYNKKIHIKY